MPWLDQEDRRVLSGLFEALLTALSLVFVALLVVEVALPLSAAWSRRVSLAGLVIWAVFVGDFVIRLALAGDKGAYLRANWFTALALLLPAFRVFRALRVLRALRGLRVARSLSLARVVTSANRALRTLQRLLQAGGSLYVAAATVAVLLLATAGMYTLERDVPGASITSFGTALWWAVSTITAIGSSEAPVTLEGRILAVLVMVYGLGIAGYLTAVLAAWLLGTKRSYTTDSELAALREELHALRRDLGLLSPRGTADAGGEASARTAREHDSGDG